MHPSDSILWDIKWCINKEFFKCAGLSTVNPCPWLASQTLNIAILYIIFLVSQFKFHTMKFKIIYSNLLHMMIIMKPKVQINWVLFSRFGRLSDLNDTAYWALGSGSCMPLMTRFRTRKAPSLGILLSRSSAADLLMFSWNQLEHTTCDQTLC